MPIIRNFRSSDKTQFRSTDFRLSDHSPQNSQFNLRNQFGTHLIRIRFISKSTLLSSSDTNKT
jgi:hypothetical protein